MLYLNDGRLWAIEVETDPSLPPGNPVELFDITLWRLQLRYLSYDVTPDGQWFVFVRRDLRRIREINVVLNWFEELKEKVPVP